MVHIEEQTLGSGKQEIQTRDRSQSKIQKSGEGKSHRNPHEHAHRLTPAH